MVRLRSSSGARLRVALRAIPASSPAVPGPVAHFKASVGVTHTEGAVTEWEDQVNGVALTPVSGSPKLVTLPSNGTAIRFTNAANSMTGTPHESWPTGNEAGSMIVCLLVEGGFFQGFGYGVNATGQARTIGFDDVGRPMFDVKGSHIAGAEPAEERMCVLVQTHDGTTSRLYMDGVLVASVEQTLATGAGQINVMQTFSGIVANGYVCEWLVYDRVLTLAEIVAKTASMLAEYVADATPPVTSTPEIVAVAVEDALIKLTINEPGLVWWALTTSATPLSKENLKIGTGAAALGSTAVLARGTVQINVTGLDGETTYYPQILARDAAMNEQAAVSVGSGATTDTPPDAAPTISIEGLTETASGAVVEWTTTDDTGPAYYLVSASEVTDAAVVIATGVALGQVTSSGAQPDITITGLPAGVTRWVAIVHVDLAGQESNVARQQFTTVAAPGIEADATVSSASALISQVNAWLADGSRTEPKVVALDTTIASGGINLSNKNNAGKPLITIRAVGTYSGTDSTDTACSVVVNGQINLSGSSNVAVYGMHVRSGGNKLINVDNATDILIDRCLIEGSGTAGGVMSNDTTSFHPFHPQGATRITVRDSVIRRGVELAYIHQTNVDIRLQGVVFDECSHDNIKVAGSWTGGGIFDCWAARWVHSPAGSGYHEDGLQVQGGKLVNWTCDGYTMVYTPVWWQQGGQPASQQSNQFCLIKHNNAASTIEVTNAAFRNCIVGNSSNLIECGGLVDKTNDLAEYNLCFKVGVVATDMRINLTTKHHNIGTHRSSTSQFGTDSVVHLYGSDASPNFAAFGAHFVNGVPFQSASGVQKDPPGMLEDLLPKTTSPLHWNYGGTKVGPYNKLRALFDPEYRATLPVTPVPGDIGWPVAPVWTERWNANGRITTSFTGSYDADGNND